MEFREERPQRRFIVGHDETRYLIDCGSIYLDADEQITFYTSSGREYDVVRKEWGYYATPSLNRRLVANDLRAVLVKNQLGNFYILLVERGYETSFVQYLREEDMSIVIWMDSDIHLTELERVIEPTGKL